MGGCYQALFPMCFNTSNCLCISLTLPFCHPDDAPRHPQDLGAGFADALAGLVVQPIEGGQRDGSLGAIKGVGIGVIGERASG